MVLMCTHVDVCGKDSYVVEVKKSGFVVHSGVFLWC
jgi:hypothetical protein